MKDLFNFIDASPTAFHCVESVKKILDEKGFKELKVFFGHISRKWRERRKRSLINAQLAVRLM